MCCRTYSVDTAMSAQLLLADWSCCKGCGLCGRVGVVSRQPLIVYEVVSQKIYMTLHCSVIYCTVSSPSSEGYNISPCPVINPPLSPLPRPPWTLAVCVVLLPVIAQLMQSQREANHVTVLTSAVNMVLQRFSSSILACKSECTLTSLLISPSPPTFLFRGQQVSSSLGSL